MKQQASKTEKLFVYGTLRYKKYQREAVGRIYKGQRTVLFEYKKFVMRLNGEPYPVIIPFDNGVVHGLLLDVGKEELRVFDDYENAIYKRQRVRLQDGSSAWAYVYAKKIV